MMHAAQYRPILAELRDDLLLRMQDEGIREGLETAYQREAAAQRTADPFELWCRAKAVQVAAAWVLSVVFVRTLEERGYVTRRRIAGEGAEDSEEQFFALAPYLTARDYLLAVFREMRNLEGVKQVFDERHNPVWVLAPSGTVARKLIEFFRNEPVPVPLPVPVPESGSGIDHDHDTRFLGDLYQDLDDEVRQKYALLQTPSFVEEFILKETLEPAIGTFGLEGVKLIDPTCGSGHFLLGGFWRLFRGWVEREPGTERRVLAQRALGQVYGTDINPYAVAIARFRLTLAFLVASGIAKLKDAPPLVMNLAVADSLLHGKTGEQGRISSKAGDGAGWGDELFALEDEAEAVRILADKYTAVVGNPPYITVKDAKLRDAYREFYKACHRGYQLVAPFVERFFDLAVEGGYVGAIVGNGFMKREFGTKLIEEVLPFHELTQVVDMSGVYIPGHGTPTAVLFGRRQRPGNAPILAVMGKRGEPSTPADAANGLVWSTIRDHHREIGFENEYLSVAEVERERFAKHPWSLGGGGAAELKALIEERAEKRLSDVVNEIGFICITRADDVYFAPPGALVRRGVDSQHIIRNVEGERIRDWAIAEPNDTVFPYDEGLAPIDEHRGRGVHRFLWPYKEILWRRREPNGDHRELGRTWWEWSRFQRERFRTPLSIAFPFVATHNHFVLDRGGKVFKQTAPIIKLPEDATEDDHLALLGYLNSSTACFWMKQVIMNKGATSDKGVLQADPEKFRFEFDATKLSRLPIPAFGLEARLLAQLARVLSDGARSLSCGFTEIIESNHPTATAMRKAFMLGCNRRDALRKELVARQEELDWLVYQLFDLIPRSDVALDPSNVPGLAPDERPYRCLAEDLPVADQATRERINAIRTLPALALIETPENKRRWFKSRGKFDAGTVDDEYTFNADLTTWALARIEIILSAEKHGLILPTLKHIAGELQSDQRFCAVAELLAGEVGAEVDGIIAGLVESAAVPYLSPHRYTDTGLEKRALWEKTWTLQRRQDAGESIAVPVPPKYDSKDFKSPVYWQLRGKLDVPKERFISYPGAESDEDPSPLIGWAGWDHLQQAMALHQLYTRRKQDDGWQAERIKPLLAGLLELVPWLLQWHNEPDPRFGNDRAGQAFDSFVRSEAKELGLTLDDLRAWRPVKASRGRGARKAATPAESPAAATESLLEAVAALSQQDAGAVTQAALATHLGITAAAAGKLLGPLIEQGLLELVSSRPKKVRLPQS